LQDLKIMISASMMASGEEAPEMLFASLRTPHEREDNAYPLEASAI
jgi:hypothetical protein